MCGIAGFSARQLSPSLGVWLSDAVQSLNHRGPDDFGVYAPINSSIGLAHTRLSILDLSNAGHQPMLSSDGRVALVFNGEIYNFKQLRLELENDGFVFVSDTDTEVLLALYLSCRAGKGNPLSHFVSKLQRLNGIFAFALWDFDTASLLLARDSHGIKPLYFSQYNGVLAFASELKALTPLVGSCQQLDVTALNRYLTFLWSPGERTPAPNIRKLGPGEMLRVRHGLVEDHTCWSVRPCCHSSRPFHQTQFISGTENLLRQAVQRQMVADVPVGAFLSGGIDSSSIVSFAREITPDLECFTIDVRQGHSEGFADDLPYAREVADHLGVPLTVVQVDAAQMAAELEFMVWQLDEPLADPASLNLLHISRLAREQGIKVLLSGAGGDDLFSGYRRHMALEAEKWWRWLPRPLRLQLRASTGHLPTSHPFTRRLRKAFSGAHLEGDARIVHYFRWIERSDLEPLFTPAFRAALGNARAEDPMFDFLDGLPSNISSLERMLALEQRFFLTDHNLLYTDKMSMAVGVEVRVPFLDPDLVEFAAQIPTQFKQRGRQSKWILKKAMEPYLPKDVIYRPKSGFGAPLRRWLQVELRDWLADTLSVERLRSRGLFDPQAVQSLITANVEGRIDASYTLLSLACIEIWCKYFLDGARSPSLEPVGH
ncbi:asparagine synthase (glutamine-hydrolyzing) [Synechococcus sp. Minos11]|uniref:asparagine synthase (glutamine-hydrolyzing) n=1 Tax=Synechococcus sp. Minos11 TaxID=221341 RepID=UPI00164955ED|nr:asparagine synthase (glutamine-hydrolyzing) [Synechococcus sp. Minos11]QNJ07706.1 asparagine synthase (glutamine-hydrolyzing) [Synechococcus sp. Minos11]